MEAWLRRALPALLFVACRSFTATDEQGGAGLDASAPDGDGSTDAAPACVLDSCAGRAASSCGSFDFDTDCPSDWSFGGDTEDVIGECKDGKLHIAAAFTLDMIARLDVTTPATFTGVRISARLAIKEWDGGSVLRVGPDGAPLVDLRASIVGGKPVFKWCNGADCGGTDTYTAAPDEPHLFVFDISPTTWTMSVDCVVVATRSGSAVTSDTSFNLRFGRTDATRIDGTIDDVVVQFR